MSSRRVLVTRAADDAEELSDLLRASGLEPVVLPLLEIEPIWRRSEIEDTVRTHRPALVVITSRRAVDPLLSVAALLAEQATPVAMVGDAAALSAHRAGLEVVAVAENAAALLDRIAELVDKAKKEGNR